MTDKNKEIDTLYSTYPNGSWDNISFSDMIDYFKVYKPSFVIDDEVALELIKVDASKFSKVKLACR